MKILNEVFLIGFNPNGDPAYSYELTEIYDTNPSDKALRSIQTFGKPAFLHSTSWRYDNRGALRLTWIAYIPGYDQFDQAIISDDIAEGPDAGHPEPERLGISNVLSHALRHLSFLLENDETFAVSLSDDARMQVFLRTQSQGMAGLIEEMDIYDL